MKNVIKNSLYATAGISLLFLNSVNAINVGQDVSTKGDNIRNGNFVGTLDNMLGYVISLLYFIAIVFALYGGFQILTAGGDEEKVKKGKTSLINAVLGLIVIFLASNIIQWIISLMTVGGGATG